MIEDTEKVKEEWIFTRLNSDKSNPKAMNAPNNKERLLIMVTL